MIRSERDTEKNLGKGPRQTDTRMAKPDRCFSIPVFPKCQFRSVTETLSEDSDQKTVTRRNVPFFEDLPCSGTAFAKHPKMRRSVLRQR